MLSNGSNAHLAQRRGFLLASAMGLAWCGHATANTGARRIGVLAPSTAAREALTLKPFFDEMARLGWAEPMNAQYDRVYADDRYQDLPRLARTLVSRQPELIFAPPLPAAVAARQATRDIPIVFATGTDPVGAGLVDSLARPGGNATGMISVIESLTPKSLGLVLELIPGMRRVGLLGDLGDDRLRQDRLALAPLLQARGIQLVVGEATDPKSLEQAVANLLAQRVEAVLTNSSLTYNQRDRLAHLVQGARAVLVGHRSEMADAGALFSYGASLADQIRRSAGVVDRILRGARPADIPVEQPMIFELVLNLKAARELGLNIPAAIRLRANRVIE